MDLPQLLFVPLLGGAFLNIPGSNDAQRRELESLFSSIQSQYRKATIALSLYQGSKGLYDELRQQKNVYDRSGDDAPLRHQLESELRTQLADSRLSPAERHQAEVDRRDRISLEIERWKIEQGMWPPHHATDILLIYAEAFIGAMDMIGKLAVAITENPLSTPALMPKLSAEIVALKNDVPGLKSVRNSIQHLEDRIRGLGRHDKKLNAKKPIPAVELQETWITSSTNSRVTILSALNGDAYTTTGLSGFPESIEVTIQSLTAVRDRLQKIFDEMPWRMRPAHL
jgi:hypothetical protein